jgi:hypothetical protein
LRIALTPDEIPKSSFERLDEKARRANDELQQVLDYCDAADDAKHDYLESHLNR